MTAFTRSSIGSSGGGGSSVITEGFEARLAFNQTILSSLWTKIAFAVEDYDLGSSYDNATNYRFTPQAEGIYLVTCQITWANLTAGASNKLAIYKNGSSIIQFDDEGTGVSNETLSLTVTVKLNGSTDYIEMFCYHDTGTSETIYSSSIFNRFTATHLGTTS